MSVAELKGQAVSASQQPRCPEHKIEMVQKVDRKVSFWGCPNDGCGLFISVELLNQVAQFFPAAPTELSLLTKRKDYHAEYVEAVTPEPASHFVPGPRFCAWCSAWQGDGENHSKFCDRPAQGTPEPPKVEEVAEKMLTVDPVTNQWIRASSKDYLVQLLRPYFPPASQTPLTCNQDYPCPVHGELHASKGETIKMNLSKEWLEKMATKENGQDVDCGVPFCPHGPEIDCACPAHPLNREGYLLGLEIEKLPPSEQQTKCMVQLSAYRQNIRKLETRATQASTARTDALSKLLEVLGAIESVSGDDFCADLEMRNANRKLHGALATAYEKLGQIYRLSHGFNTQNSCHYVHTNWREELKKFAAPGRVPQAEPPKSFLGLPVYVDNPQFTGYGMATYDSGDRKRVIGVLLENGNTWEYDATTVREARHEELPKMPRFIRERFKPWAAQPGDAPQKEKP